MKFIRKLFTRADEEQWGHVQLKSGKWVKNR